MRTIDGDITAITTGVIAHQVNCQGVMGAGVARAIAETHPLVLDRYRTHCQSSSRSELLGTVLAVEVTEQLVVLNVFGQNTFGRDRQRTDYPATDAAWTLIGDAWPDETIHIPYGMGCGLGGGDWPTYVDIVERHHQNVIAVRL